MQTNDGQRDDKTQNDTRLQQVNLYDRVYLGKEGTGRERWVAAMMRV